MTRPAFLITIDNEGDNLWSRPREIRTGNARFLPRFQALCERYGLKPVYLTNWEMAHSEVFQELGKDVLRRGRGEVGMHLHAWNSPPLEALTGDDYYYQPYLIEYPETQLREKIRTLTSVLEETFSTKMVSHRAGRWAFNETYARGLVDCGYRVDCSVTPRISWRGHRGNPAGTGGSDYRYFPTRAYFVDLGDIARAGNSSLLEAPMTILHSVPRPIAGMLDRYPRIGDRVRGLLPAPRCLRPDGRNGEDLPRVLDAAVEAGTGYVEFMLHSSELMPGGSPRFPTPDSIDRLYDDLERLFSAAAGRFVGMTLQEYYERARAAN
jgi:hypothetical protein